MTSDLTSDWRSLCQGWDVPVDGSALDVPLRDGRHHWVSVEDANQWFKLAGVVVRADVVAALVHLPLDVWRRNRSTPLVGFRIDREGILVGEAWLPKAGVTAEEFQFYVRTVAAECDRFEHTLTGQDQE